jgi:hypothetical protein
LIEVVLQSGIKRQRKKSTITNSSDMTQHTPQLQNTSRICSHPTVTPGFHPLYLGYGFSASLFNTIFASLDGLLKLNALPHIHDAQTSNGMHPSGGSSWLSSTREMISQSRWRHEVHMRKMGDDDVSLIIDQNNDTVYCVQDAGGAVNFMGESRAATE